MSGPAFTYRSCSVHTHSTMCDGKNTLAEMARAACAAGVRFFGASGHSHTPIPYDQGNVLPEDLSAYRAEVLRLREAFEGRMEVLLGIEQDACSLDSVPSWADYWIGSVHHLPGNAPGEYHAIDWDVPRFLGGVDALSPGDPLGLVERYYEAVAAMARRKPTILGHIDLITKLNGGGDLFDEDCPRYRRAALGALDAVDPRATLLEVNTGAIARGYRTAPYPALFLLEAWRARGGRIILTADAHTVSGILCAYDDAAALARSAGFSAACLLTRSGLLDCPLDCNKEA